LILILFVCLNCKDSASYQILKTPYPVVDRFGKNRSYQIFIPAEIQAQLPLLVYFHGVRSAEFKSIPALSNYTGSPVEETGLIGFCRINRIILLAPEPAYSYTFLDKISKGWLPFEKEMDGIEKLIDLVVKKYPIDQNKIFLAGISAGAGFCHQLANKRPDFYNAILSHSQGYVDEKGRILIPKVPGPQFGVLFCYTRGDYKNIIDITTNSEKKYRSLGYRTLLLKDLPPRTHRWSNGSNRRLWRYLQKVGRIQ